MWLKNKNTRIKNKNMRYVKIDIYFAHICKHEHENNMKRLWCKIVPKTDVEQNF
jgi:hypothetical protein